VTGKAQHSARDSWVYIDGETLGAVRRDIGDDPEAPWLRIAWKMAYTAKDTWLGPTQNLGALAALYNLTMDPFEKYDMFFNGAVSVRSTTNSPGKYAGEDNGWAISLLDEALMQFNRSIVKYPSIARFPGGASNDLLPNLQNPENPLPLLGDLDKVPKTVGAH
jgi:arylsulfatase